MATQTPVIPSLTEYQKGFIGGIDRLLDQIDSALRYLKEQKEQGLLWTNPKQR